MFPRFKGVFSVLHRKMNPNPEMTLLRSLGIPFHLTALLFVAVTATIAAGALFYAMNSPPGSVQWALAIPVFVIMMVWITRYAFHLIDAAANGSTVAPVASVEMLSLLGDPRCWVHPATASAIVLLLHFNPGLPRLPVLIGAAALFPASLGAMVMSGRAVDAFNPYAIARVIGGLAHYYLLVLLLAVACAILALAVFRSGVWPVVGIAVSELLLLMTYTFLGGVMHARRIELDFAPSIAPEAQQDREAAERARQRQEVLDAIYRDLRVRESGRAIARAQEWLAGTSSAELSAHLHAMLEASTRWNETREFPKLLRGLLPALIDKRQTALAFELAEAGLAANSGFAPAAEPETLALIRFAQHTGRRRLAQALLDNYLATTPAPQPGQELMALQAALAEKKKA